MAQKTDEEIALEVQRGNGELFGLLVNRYEKKIARYAKKFLADYENIRDLTQEVFIKAFVNIRSFNTERKFSPWIYRIAHNEFVNALKKARRLPVFPLDLDILLPHLAVREVADSEAAKRDLRRVLDRCLAKLDAKYREPLVLYFFEDLDYRMIAEILAIPVSTVGVRLARGKTQLRKLAEKLNLDA